MYLCVLPSYYVLVCLIVFMVYVVYVVAYLFGCLFVVFGCLTCVDGFWRLCFMCCCLFIWLLVDCEVFLDLGWCYGLLFNCSLLVTCFGFGFWWLALCTDVTLWVC